MEVHTDAILRASTSTIHINSLVNKSFIVDISINSVMMNQSICFSGGVVETIQPRHIHEHLVTQ